MPELLIANKDTGKLSKIKVSPEDFNGIQTACHQYGEASMMLIDTKTGESKKQVVSAHNITVLH